MKNVVVLTNKSGTTYRVGKTCADLILAPKPVAPEAELTH